MNFASANLRDWLNLAQIWNGLSVKALTAKMVYLSLGIIKLWVYVKMTFSWLLNIHHMHTCLVALTLLGRTTLYCVS